MKCPNAKDDWDFCFGWLKNHFKVAFALLGYATAKNYGKEESCLLSPRAL
ncbi:hypothetical protein E5D99_00500 [Helicobacter pylori]|nr:hypothetical protein E5D99_00500 [Helicobacter pylori]